MLWIALIGADRINFLGQHSAFVLTPFLVLTPLVLVTELWRRHKTHSGLTVPAGAVPFVVTALALVSISMASVFVSRDFSSAAPRVVLLCVIISGTLGVSLVTRDRNDLLEILAQGGRLGVALFATFNVAAILSWLNLIPPQFPNDLGILRFAPYLYAGIIPRLAGIVEDANRGGLLLLLFAYLIGLGDRNRGRAWRWMSFAALLLILTLSRSAMLASAGVLSVLAMTRASFGMPKRFILTASVLIVAISTTLLLVPRAREFASIGLSPLVQRLTVAEGSSQDHLHLLQRGVYVGTRSINAAVTGLGYGSSHTVLQDFFPGNRFGNFHSVYIGMFAEAGIFALILLLVLIGVPLISHGQFRPLVAGVALFGVFYGSLAEPAFWFTIVFGWVGLPAINSRPKATARPTANASTAPRNN